MRFGNWVDLVEECDCTFRNQAYPNTKEHHASMESRASRNCAAPEELPHTSPRTDPTHPMLSEKLEFATRLVADSKIGLRAEVPTLRQYWKAHQQHQPPGRSRLEIELHLT